MVWYCLVWYGTQIQAHKNKQATQGLLTVADSGQSTFFRGRLTSWLKRLANWHQSCHSLFLVGWANLLSSAEARRRLSIFWPSAGQSSRIRAITFSTNLCIMAESLTELFAYLVTRWKLYYIITSHMSTQMKVHRWQKNCKRSCFKEQPGTCHHCKFIPLQVQYLISSHTKNARSLHSSPILGTDCSICLSILVAGIRYSKDLITSSEEEECAPGGLYTVLVARGPVVVGLTPLAILLQFQVLHSTLIHSVVASLP